MLSRSYIILFIACTLLGCASDPVALPEDYECLGVGLPDNTHPFSADFDSFLEEKAEEGLPGISMLIKTPQGFYAGSAGVADIPNDIPLETCHLHRIGSVTKQFTAAMIMLLYQDGLLDLDDKMSEYLSDRLLKDIANREMVTIRQLLTHSSGIPDVYDIDFWLEYYDDPTRVRRVEDELDYIRNVEADFSPGTHWHYSNSNYILLQLILEAVSGKGYEEFLSERILNPLGLESTTFSSQGKIPSSIVRGYTDEFEDGYLRDVTNYTFGIANGTGGVFSNLYDLYKFHEAFTIPDVLFSEDILNRMMAPKELPFFDEEAWDFGVENKVKKVNGIGMGWLEIETDIGMAYGHNGGLMGRKARAWYFPEQRSHIIYFINADGGLVNDVSRNIFRNEMIDLLNK